jgi:hypothetical protein
LLVILLIAGQVPSVKAQAINFPHENVSDLRGILNLFHAFRRACLEQPTDRDLPYKIAPEGYQIVSRMTHLWGEKSNDDPDDSGENAIISRTGSEQEDWDGGHLFIDFLMPTDEKPDGHCSVKWKRAWDYKEDQARIALGMFGVFDAQISYHLKAVLKSRPDDSFIWKRRSYGGVSDWVTRCWDAYFCNFKVLYDINPKRGIDISITREVIER